MPSDPRNSDKSLECLNNIKTDADLARSQTINSAIQLGSGDEITAVADTANISSADIVAVSVIDDLLTDLDLNPTSDDGVSDAEIMTALHALDDVAVPDPVAPVDDWLTDVRELARKHGPMSAMKILQIVRELDTAADEARS